MKLTLLDVETSNKIDFEIEDDQVTIWQWTEGNFSCDCNRAFQFSEELDDEMDERMRKNHPELKEWQSCCWGSKRFLVIKVDPIPKEFTIKDFNEDYPEALLDKFLEAK